MKHQLALPFSDDKLYDGRWECLLIVSPDRNVTMKVMEVKEDFYTVHRQKIAIDTWPHITIALFRAKQKLERSLIEMMQEVCNKQREFLTRLNDFGGFEHTTIYIKVQDYQPFLQLAEGLKVINSCLLNNGCSSAYLVNTPHLTIARGIPYLVYIKAVQEYSQRSFHDSFLVKSLLLLKRRHRDDNCKRVATLHLSPQPSYFFNQKTNQHAKANYQHSGVSCI